MAQLDDPEQVVETTAPDAYGWEELRSSGLLWLINAAVLHPRGYALSLAQLGGTIVGWRLLGDGSEPWQFDRDIDDQFAAVQRLLGGRP
jgi:hypothetical protein